jgi:hypothetical protein
MRFMSYDLNPKRPNQVTVAVFANGRTRFVAVGDLISGTPYKVQRFESKEVAKGDGTTTGQSEITLLDPKTNQPTVLSFNRALPAAPRR